MISGHANIRIRFLGSGDNFGGIPFFILDAQLISRRGIPLVIAGPPGLTQRVREAWNTAATAIEGIGVSNEGNR